MNFLKNGGVDGESLSLHPAPFNDSITRIPSVHTFLLVGNVPLLTGARPRHGITFAQCTDKYL